MLCVMVPEAAVAVRAAYAENRFASKFTATSAAQPAPLMVSAGTEPSLALLQTSTEDQ